MSNLARNLHYLSKITEKLEALPLFIMRRASYYTFVELVTKTVNENFDSGQAAANWRIEGYVGTPSFKPQMMMWGYDDIQPVAPVGFKTWSFGLLEGGGGDPVQVLSSQVEYAITQTSQLTNDYTGVSVYNPIKSGFAGFFPGTDKNYEKNALEGTSQIIASAAASGLARAEAEALLTLRN